MKASSTGTQQSVQGAVARASRATGAGFDYLLNTAARESALDPAARARTSSATGLFQFIESTWLTMVKEEGPKHGLDAYASTITRGPDGQYRVANPAVRQEILALRTDPETSATMAGELTRRNAAHLGAALGRKASEGELYAAHVLGGEGATRLVTAAARSPDTPAAGLFPAEAQANRALFHDASGRPRTAAELYARLTIVQPGTVAQPGPAASVDPGAVSEAAPEFEDGPALTALGDRYQRVARVDAPVFHRLFSSAKGPEPVNAFVAHQWGGKGQGASPDATTRPDAPPAPVSQPRPTAASAQAPAVPVPRGTSGRAATERPLELVPGAPGRVGGPEGAPAPRRR